MAAQQTNMEEILTSIRTTLAEETAKVGTPAAPNGTAAEMSDEEVLALSEDDVMPATPAARNDETVDLTAFGQAGEMKMQAAGTAAAEADVLGEGTAEAVAPAMPAAPAAPAPVAPPAVAEAKSDDLDKILEDIKSTPAAPAPVVAHAATEAPDVVSLGLVGDVADLQVALPAEVLAAALRPLVQTWLEQNLAGVVERLVQAEISKLSNPE